MKNSEIPKVTIDGHTYSGHYSKTRLACRAITIEEDKILLSYAARIDLWMTPGGGREEGESERECVVRELIEETGYIIEPLNIALEMTEYYEEERYITYYFLCKIKGQTDSKPTEGEENDGIEPRWISVKEAISIFSNYQRYSKSDIRYGTYLREYLALKKILDL